MAIQVGNVESRGNPNLAALFTWVVPGAGHLYLGRPAMAVLLFVLVEGLYLLGLRLSDGMAFEYLDLELRSTFAPVLAPEIGNLGGFVYQMKVHGFGPGAPRPWPEWMQLGSWLCGISGILNVAAMTLAHLDARRARGAKVERLSPGVLMLCAWCVPGLGHVLQGRKQRGVIVFLLLVGLFVAGTVLADASNLSRERHFYYWSGQFLLGLPGLAAELLWGSMRVRAEIPLVDCGLVFGCVAGLLNVLAMIDVFGWGEAKLLGLPQRTSHVEETQGVVT